MNRYTLGRLEGFNSSSRKPSDTWYVYDSLWCYRIVGEFHNRREGSFWKGYRRIPAELQARSKARKLERAHHKMLRRQGLL